MLLNKLRYVQPQIRHKKHEDGSRYSQNKICVKEAGRL